MAFSFGAPKPAGGNIAAELGPELPDLYAEVCGADVEGRWGGRTKFANSCDRKSALKVSPAIATFDYFLLPGPMTPFPLRRVIS